MFLNTILPYIPLHVSKSCNKILQHEHDVFAIVYIVQ